MDFIIFILAVIEYNDVVFVNDITATATSGCGTAVTTSTTADGLERRLFLRLVVVDWLLACDVRGGDGVVTDTSRDRMMMMMFLLEKSLGTTTTTTTRVLPNERRRRRRKGKKWRDGCGIHDCKSVQVAGFFFISSLFHGLSFLLSQFLLSFISHVLSCRWSTVLCVCVFSWSFVSSCVMCVCFFSLLTQRRTTTGTSSTLVPLSAGKGIDVCTAQYQVPSQ